MKKTLLCFLTFLLVSGAAAHAQGRYPARPSFGVLAGSSLQAMTGKNFSGDRLENGVIPGFHAGVNYQLPLFSEFYIQPGLFFSSRGTRDNDYPEKRKIRISYLEVPLSFLYKTRLPDGYFFAGIGPYAAYGLAGKALYESGAADRKTDIEFKDVLSAGDPLSGTYFKRVDAGGSLFVGYEMIRGLSLQLHVQAGLTNISPRNEIAPNSEALLRNLGAGLSLGFRFP